MRRSCLALAAAVAIFGSMTIEIDAKARPDGILADPFNNRIYVFSHPTMDATVIDAKTMKVTAHYD